MKLVGIIGTVLLSLILAAPVYAQEQHDQDEQKDQKEQTAKPAQDEKKAETEKSAKQDEKGAQPDKNAKPEEKNAQQEKNTKPEEKSAQQENNGKQEEKTTQQHAQPAKNAGGIPADRYKANFGREHTFRVSQGDYNNHRFQYGATGSDSPPRGRATGSTRNRFLWSTSAACITFATRRIPESMLNSTSHSNAAEHSG